MTLLAYLDANAATRPESIPPENATPTCFPSQALRTASSIALPSFSYFIDCIFLCHGSRRASVLQDTDVRNAPYQGDSDAILSGRALREVFLGFTGEASHIPEYLVKAKICRDVPRMCQYIHLNESIDSASSSSSTVIVPNVQVSSAEHVVR